MAVELTHIFFPAAVGTGGTGRAGEAGSGTDAGVVSATSELQPRAVNSPAQHASEPGH